MQDNNNNNLNNNNDNWQLLILRNLGFVNEKSREITDKAVGHSSTAASKYIEKVNEYQNSYYHNLPVHFRGAIDREKTRRDETTNEIERTVTYLEHQQVVNEGINPEFSNEADLINVERWKINNEAEYTRRVGNLLNQSGVDLGSKYASNCSSRDEMVNSNNRLTNKLVEHMRLKKEFDSSIAMVESKIENDNSNSSLIDDFANPNLEQPGYMDPED